MASDLMNFIKRRIIRNKELIESKNFIINKNFNTVHKEESLNVMTMEQKLVVFIAIFLLIQKILYLGVEIFEGEPHCETVCLLARQ